MLDVKHIFIVSETIKLYDVEIHIFAISQQISEK